MLLGGGGADLGRLLALEGSVGGQASLLLEGGALFIGPTDDDNVGIFRGLNGSVAGLELYSEVTDSGLPISSLPEFQQARIREGITVGDVEEAESTVEGYRDELEEAETESGGGRAGGGAARATDDPTPAP